MKYANSLKYADKFKSAKDRSDLSVARLGELCNLLGKVNQGAKHIFFSGGCGSHGCAELTSSILQSAGYRVGHLSNIYGYDVRKSVKINGRMPSIDDCNRATDIIKQVLNKNENRDYRKEEIVVAFALVVFMIEGCDFVLLEESTENDGELFDVCSPYDLLLIPSALTDIPGKDRMERIRKIIKHVRHEVVSGNQRTDIFNSISSMCSNSGIRITMPAKTRFIGLSETPRKITFEYKEKGGYTLRSGSYMLRECVVLAIELSYAIRRIGMKIPADSIIKGIENAGCSGYFEILTACPTLITDMCCEDAELLLLAKNINDTMSVMSSDCLSLAFEAESCEELLKKLSCFENLKLFKVYVLCREELIKSCTDITCELNCMYFNDIGTMIREVLKDNTENNTALCFGKPCFVSEFSENALRLINPI